MSRREARDWSSDFVHETKSCRQLALAVSAAFAILGITWVLATDIALTAFSDPLTAERIHLALDWVFIIVASTALFLFAHRAAMRLSEAHGVLSAVVRSIGDGLLVLGRDRTIIYANPAAVRMLECGDASQLVGMDAAEFTRHFLVSYPNGVLVKPDALASQRAFTHPGTLHYKTVIHPSPDDELVILSSAAGVRDNPDDHASLVVSVLHDITSEEHLEQLRDQFFAAAAHALKTPVAIIKANVQLIAESPKPSQPSVLAVQRQCDRIDLLVQNLLVVARARTRTLELFPQELELQQLVESTAHEIVAERAAPHVTTEIVGSPPIRGDRERLQLVVRNLAHEALLAARPKSSLTLRLTPYDKEVELTVVYDPLPVAERTYAGAEDHDEATLGRCATTTIVEAHGGITGEQTVDDHHALLWVRLPVTARAA